MTTRLSYFDIEGYGECIRLALKFAGVDFEDRRVSFEDWPELKPTLPNGTMPVLEMDGKVLTETYAILRLIGHKYDMLPTDAEAQYDCDQLIETCLDIFSMLSKIYLMRMFPERFGCENLEEAELDARIEKIQKTCLDGQLHDALSRIDALVPNTKFLETGKVTIADIFAYCTYRYVSLSHVPGIPTNSASHCKNLLSLREKFLVIPCFRKHYGLPSAMLTYFNIEGLGAPIRIALKLAGVEFEDRKVDFSEWKTMKHTTPNGVLPVLVLDGRVLPQYSAIMRYLGTKYDLMPKDANETYIVDEVFETVHDLNGTLKNSVRIGLYPNDFGWENPDKEEQKAVIKKMREDAVAGPLPKMLERLSTLLKNSGVVAGKKMNIADIYAYVSLRKFRKGILDHVPKDIYTEYENLNTLIYEMEKNPVIQEMFNISIM